MVPAMIIPVALRRVVPAATLLVVAAILLAGCSSVTPAATPQPSSTGQAPGTTKTSDGGQVTVVVDWGGPAEGVVFDVQLDTHSVDLDALDLASATLTNDRGETMRARPWTAPKGGHHREGELTFDGESSAFLANAKWIELVITGVGDLPERRLRWEIVS